MKEDDVFIERRIITGLIISTDYLKKVRKVWNSKLLGAKSAKLLANWCIEFYDKYYEAPGDEIESIFLKKSKGLSDGDIKDIEDILSGLSDEYEHQEKFNVAYLVDQTIAHFDERNLRAFIADLRGDLDEGNILQAKKTAFGYRPAISVEDKDIDLSEKAVLDTVEEAFTTTSEPVVRYSRQLGEFLNPQLVRSGFIAFMGPEKRGKTWILQDIGITGARQGANVAFFLAGDMTKAQQLKRICINLAKKSDKERYSGKMWEPVRDCIHNQMNTCTRKERECDFGIFEDKEEKEIRQKIKLDDLINAYDKKYKPCHNCTKYWQNRWGAVWLKKVNTGEPLTVDEAKKTIKEFFIDHKRRFRMSPHSSGTLTATEIDSTLDLWERQDGFVADLIIVDFADIMASESSSEFRHQENEKWLRLRGISQKRHALVVTATWTDSNSYDANLLSLKNFSEDKRKYGHVTAMYGLNQDKDGREKEIGIMRINEIVVREGEFLSSNVVHVLQNLRRGQPALSSYW